MFKTKRGVKRAVSLLLTFCMVFSLITVNGSTVSAKETSCELTEGDYNYIELSDGTVEITKYISTADNLEMGETYELIIPSTLGGKT